MARSKRPHTIYRFWAYDGEYRARDRVHGYTHHKVFEHFPAATLPDTVGQRAAAEAAAAAWMAEHPPLAAASHGSQTSPSVRIEEHNPRTGDSYQLHRWEPRGGVWTRV
jgi:hypothetical protein